MHDRRSLACRVRLEAPVLRVVYPRSHYADRCTHRDSAEPMRGGLGDATISHHPMEGHEITEHGTPDADGAKPAALSVVREGLLRHRGRANELCRLAERVVVPVLCLDNQARLVKANAASRLFLRRTREQLRRMTAGDLLTPRQLGEFERVWTALLRDGSGRGSMDITPPDGTVTRVDYVGLANVVPGRHILIWVPSQWPADELTVLIDANATAPTGRLSGRERQVVTLLACGASVEQIAAELSVAPSTAKTHMRNALRRLGARNRANAVALAIRAGEIVLDGSDGDS